jgi:hypothetical protein
MQFGLTGINKRVGGNSWRTRSIARARQSFIASASREGRVMRQVHRAFIATSRPMTMTELLPWAYPQLQRHDCWHRWSVRRALLRYAEPIGRSTRGRGLPGIWQLKGGGLYGITPAKIAIIKARAPA